MYLEARWLHKSTKDGQEDYEHHTQEPICMWGLGLGFRYVYITHTHTGKHCMWPPLWPQPPRSAPTHRVHTLRFFFGNFPPQKKHSLDVGTSACAGSLSHTHTHTHTYTQKHTHTQPNPNPPTHKHTISERYQNCTEGCGIHRSTRA